MMQIIKCINCDKSHIGLGNVFVNLTFSKTEKCCDKCNNTKTNQINYFFCSPECCENYMHCITDLQKIINI
jgi:hypothetical protein